MAAFHERQQSRKGFSILKRYGIASSPWKRWCGMKMKWEPLPSFAFDHHGASRVRDGQDTCGCSLYWFEARIA